MKVTFFSNFLNHHQLPFCEAMCKLTENQFIFVATSEIPKERLNMGYVDMNTAYPFVVRSYESQNAEHEAERLAIESDVIIIGSAPAKYIRIRMTQAKLTFRYSERLYKKGLWRVLSPQGLRSMMLNHRKYRNAPLYMLCASAYTALDYSLTGCYPNKMFKWGYFPKVKQYDVAELMKKKLSVTSAGWKHPRASILWAGRLIGWKHPEASIQLAASLKKKGYSFRMSIIGNGEMKEQLEKMIVDKKLLDCVEMLGAMSPDEVRVHMEKADIFLFTSDFNEGWGAVLNESMNSGCAVVASHAIGSVPFLIEDGVNGLIYKNGDMHSLCSSVMRLLDEPLWRQQIGINAYSTLEKKWNADVAAERFFKLSESILKGKLSDLYEDGPCSKAAILTNWWYKNR